MSTSNLAGLRSRFGIAFLAAALAASCGAAAQDLAPKPVTPAAPVSEPGTALAAAAAAATQAPPLTADDVGAWLDGFMPNALKQGDIAGAVVIVVKDGDKDVTYYFDEKADKDNHKSICTEAKNGTVTGKVSEKDGKKVVTASKVSFD